MNSWRHSDSSTVRTRRLQHRLCLWNAHHPWTRYILFPSLSSVVVSFLSRNGQQISLNDERSQMKSSSSTFAICACCLPQSHKLRNCLVQQKTLITEKKKTSRNNCLEAALHKSLFKFFLKQERSPNWRLEDCWKNLSTLGTREPVPWYRYKMVLCSQFEYPIWDCVHSYSISPCQTPFWDMTWA